MYLRDFLILVKGKVHSTVFNPGVVGSLRPGCDTFRCSCILQCSIFAQAPRTRACRSYQSCPFSFTCVGISFRIATRVEQSSFYIILSFVCDLSVGKRWRS